MLAVPRPRTRAECLQEARPCPWVGCRHHLLLEVATSEGKPTKLVLNRSPARASQVGRKPGLYSSAAEALVRVWIDDAIDLLTRMRHTCSLDVVDEQPPDDERIGFRKGLSDRKVGEHLGVSKQAAHERTAKARVRLRIGLGFGEED